MPLPAQIKKNRIDSAMSIAESVAQKSTSDRGVTSFADQREEAIQQKQMQHLMTSSPRSQILGSQHNPISRSVSGEIIQAKGDIALAEERPGLSTEEGVAAADDDAYVYLTRGVVPTQKQLLQNKMIDGSYVSFDKIIRAAEDGEPEHDVAKPSAEQARAYVAQSREPLTQNLIEFTSQEGVAKGFASGAGQRFSFVLTIRIQKKYLTKGSTGEAGWIALQHAPYQVVHVQKFDGFHKTNTHLTDAEFRAVIEKEKVAIYLKKTDEDLAKHMATIPLAEKAAEGRKLLALRTTRKAETEAERGM